LAPAQFGALSSKRYALIFFSKLSIRVVSLLREYSRLGVGSFEPRYWSKSRMKGFSVYFFPDEDSYSSSTVKVLGMSSLKMEVWL
jgi:hypothetical protein